MAKRVERTDAPEASAQEQRANALMPLETSMIDVVGFVSGVAAVELVNCALSTAEPDPVCPDEKRIALLLIGGMAGFMVRDGLFSAIVAAGRCPGGDPAVGSEDVLEAGGGLLSEVEAEAELLLAVSWLDVKLLAVLAAGGGGSGAEAVVVLAVVVVVEVVSAEVVSCKIWASSVGVSAGSGGGGGGSAGAEVVESLVSAASVVVVAVSS